MATKRSKKHVRLSTDILPVSYDLHLTPDLQSFTFSGRERIELNLKKPSRVVTMHAKELEIDSASIVLNGSTLNAVISFDDAADTVTLAFPRAIPKGAAYLEIEFRGILNDKMHGFYRSSYDLNGGKRYLATTQFESTDARRAFPCFDEPALKAVFHITLTVPNDKTVISNTLPTQETKNTDGSKTVRFAPTPPMSTYLAAFIVGDFEHIQKKSTDGVLVRVFTTPGKKHQAKFALECAAKTITFFNKYFDIPYPMPVVDLIAIPDFAAGAMENWGAITYRETALLVDPKQSATLNKQWVALVIAHELAHQWFGNLVTMEWWTHLWLNEGFASYIEYLAVDHLFPSWDMWTQFLNGDMRPALHLDALLSTHPIEVEVHHPSEIASVFDAVSYSKGASIIRMLAEYLGEKNFRNGLRYYLKKHRYGNTITEDLWRALEHVSQKPVEKIMAKWTAAAGYPLVTVTQKSGTLALTQERFFESPSSKARAKDVTRWHIPISLATPRGKTREQILMTARAMRIDAPTGWIKLNAGETAFFRTAYSPALQSALGKAAADKQLTKQDRLGLIRDIFALIENGTLGAVDALQFVQHFTSETEYVIWAEIASSLASMHVLTSNESFSAGLESFARRLFAPIGRKMSWGKAPKDHSQSLLRILILGALGRYGDAATIQKARELFASATQSKNSIPADLRGVVYATVARHGGAQEFTKLREMYRTASLHEEKNRIGAALGQFRDPVQLQETLDFSISDNVRPQDCVRLIASVGMNPRGSDLAWRFIQKNWGVFVERFGASRDLSHLLESVGFTAGRARASELRMFMKAHPAPGTERSVAQTLERIESNAAWIKRDRKTLEAFLAS